MRNMRIFQSSRGRFTAAIQVMPDGRILGTYALCGPNDRYVRRTGYDRAVGLFNSIKNPPIELGHVDVDNTNLVEEVFKPWYAAIAQLDVEAFGNYDYREGGIVNVLETSLLAPVTTG